MALLTGGGSGIGAVLAERLASRGHDLLLVSRDADRAHPAAVALAGRHGVRVDVLVADLATRHGLFRLEALLSGPEALAVDVLVHDAVPDAGTGSVDDLQTAIDLGVTAPMRLTHAALPGMRRRGRGTIVTVARPAAPAPVHGVPGTEWAAAFTASLAPALEGSGVRAVLVRSEDPPDRALAAVDGTDPASGRRGAPLRGLSRRAVEAGARAARRGAELFSDATRRPLMPPAGAAAAPVSAGAPRRPLPAPGCGRPPAPEELLAGTSVAGRTGPVRAPSRLPDLPVRPGAGRATAAASGCGRSAHYLAGPLRTAEQRARATAAARDRTRTRHGSPHGAAAVSGG